MTSYLSRSSGSSYEGRRSSSPWEKKYGWRIYPEMGSKCEMVSWGNTA